MRRLSRTKTVCLIASFATLVIASALCGCRRETSDGRYWGLMSDIAMLRIGSDSCVQELILDSGERYEVPHRVSAGMRDTTLRCFVSYSKEEGGRVALYSLKRAFTQAAYPAESFKLQNAGSGENWVGGLPRYPMKVVSMWKSGGYLNMHLGMLTTGKGKHTFAFCKDSVGCYSLLHLRPANDMESYTEDAYLSMPFPEREDSVRFTVYTYDGLYSKTFYK